MSQLNDKLEEIVKLYKSGQVDTARRLFKDIEAQYPNYPNVLWVWANISPSKDEQIQSLQLLLRIKPDGNLADSARKRLYKLQPSPPRDVDEFESLPPIQPASQHLNYPQQVSYNPQPTINNPTQPIYPIQYPPPIDYPTPPSNLAQTNIFLPPSKIRYARIKLFRFGLMMTIVGLILFSFFSFARMRFWITYSESSIWGTRQQTTYISSDLTLAQIWGAQFYVIPSQYIVITRQNEIFIAFSAYSEMTQIGAIILFIFYIIPLGFFVVASQKIIVNHRRFLAIWAVINVVLIVMVIQGGYQGPGGGIIPYGVCILLLFILAFGKLPPISDVKSSLAYPSIPAYQSMVYAPQNVAQQPAYPNLSRLQIYVDSKFKQAGWVSVRSTPQGVYYEKHPGVYGFIALPLIIVFALLGLIVVLMWLVFTKKMKCFMRYNQNQVTIYNDQTRQWFQIVSEHDIQQLFASFPKGRVGYGIVVAVGIVSMVANGIILSNMMR